MGKPAYEFQAGEEHPSLHLRAADCQIPVHRRLRYPGGLVQKLIAYGSIQDTSDLKVKI